MEQLRVVTRMSSLSESKKSTRSEYIDMTLESMREYLASRKEMRHTTGLFLQKDSCEETNSNIQMDEVALQKMFAKDDFMQLKVVGQFNKGFILATMHDKELFILD